MKWALVDANETVVNTIVYDGVSDYEPPEGQTLQEVNDWLDIGDSIYKPYRG